MSRQAISLKTRVRYEGRAQIFDRRTEREELPDPIWRTVGHILRSQFKSNVPKKRASLKKP